MQLMDTDERPIMPPALESLHQLSSSLSSSKSTPTPPQKKQSLSSKSNKSNNKPSSSSSMLSKAHCHKNAVQRIQNQLVDSKEHIDRTVLPSSSSFGGRPCLNMKVFLKLMSDKSKKQQNLDALYSLVEHDSDSIIGFVELNGLSFIDEWLDSARKSNNHWFSLCILQFLAHQNLCITYEALQTAPIAKAVKQFINPSNTNSAASSMVLSPQSLPRITDEIKALLPDNLDCSRANDNFIRVIDRTVLHSVCHQHKDLDTIRFLQSQFASRIVNKWKKYVSEWKKHNNRPLYRSVRFSDEKCKALADSTTFHLMDPPMNITQQRDKKRRDKMQTTIKWTQPQKMQIEEILDSDSKPIERGRDSKEKKVQKERIMQEMEEFSIGTDNLKDPKSLSTNQSIKSTQKPVIIPLESEQSTPTPEAQKPASTNPNGSNAAHPNVNMAAPYGHMMPPHHGHGHHIYPPPPHHYYHPGYPPHPHQARMPPVGYPQHAYHPSMHHPGYPVGYPPNMQYRPPPTHQYPAYAMQQQQPGAPANAAAASSQQSSVDSTKNGGHRRREFEIDRPAKRQKTEHTSAYPNDRDYRRRTSDNRKKHRSKHEKSSRHKSSKERGRGRRSNKEGMQIDAYSFSYHASTMEFSVIEYFDDDDDDEQTEYLFVVYMFLFWAFCYVFFGNKFGMIW